MSAVTSLLDRLRSKNLDRWVPGYARYLAGRLADRVRTSPVTGPRHLLFAMCDHYEPLWRKPDAATATARVAAWSTGYPKLAAEFRDADGRPPRHSFFFPGEQYDPAFLDPLAALARQGLGEVELHLHHDGDTGPKLREDLRRFLELFARHGHLSRQGDRLRYGFIHGNWCLANARRDGRMCGVDDELPILFETGCYADFTFPSAPDESQPGIVNQIYWPTGDLAQRRCYEQGQRARVGERLHDRILMIEGPLAPVVTLSGKPLRIEASAILPKDPPTPARVRTWVAQDIHVAGRPEWVFVKLHIHGAKEAQAADYLGAGGRALHAELTTRYNDGVNWRLHYVTAREMYNVAVAAMDGCSGDPSRYFDHELPRPPAAG